MPAPLTPVAAPGLARRIERPEDLANETLLRSYRADEWPTWLAAAGAPDLIARGPVFDSSVTMAAAAMAGAGVAILPSAMFRDALDDGRLIQLFETEIATGDYWLTRLKTRAPGAAMTAFRDWIMSEAIGA